MQLNDFLKAGGPKIRKELEQHPRYIEILPLPTCNGAGCYFAQAAASLSRLSPMERFLVLICVQAIGPKFGLTTSQKIARQSRRILTDGNQKTGM
ncbi:Uncharacterised protein [Enterobacter cloacae]|uniref:Uncharacterized protein n=1 Tax=Enterobacter cloacae TaxID=550 RepID=A0A377LZE4_ENTCL|nr:Uncharacterised protein [Enterobacter cloacae]